MAGVAFENGQKNSNRCQILVASRLICLLLSFCPLPIGIIVVAADVNHPLCQQRKLDLSYLHNVPAPKIASVVQDELKRLKQKGQEQEYGVSIDLSCSALGDEGFKSILDAILPSKIMKEDEEFQEMETEESLSSEPNTVNVALRCQLNDLTPLSAKYLLERILRFGSKCNNNETPAPSPSILQQQQRLGGGVLPQRRISSLDLDWNHLSTDELGGNDNFLHLLGQVMAEQPKLTLLALEQCGLGPAECRALAKGVLNRNQPKKPRNNDSHHDEQPTISSNYQLHHAPPEPLSLRLACNPWIGDAGTAALAAAIRSLAMDYNDKEVTTAPECNAGDEDEIMREKKNMIVLLDTLDLSGCDITDIGAQALALALEDVPEGCIAVRHLKLAHNKITERGATALGRALLVCSNVAAISSTLDLSHNNIGDRGAFSLAAVFEQGRIPNLILRSCHIHADGGAAMGKALFGLTTTTTTTSTTATKRCSAPTPLCLDLSGNPLGVLRGKNKSSGEGGKYSASRLKTTATATAASYMNQIKKGWKKSGVADFWGGASGRTDSDDEEANTGEVDSDNEEAEVKAPPDASKKRCGIKALTNAFLGTETNENRGGAGSTEMGRGMLQVNLGLRHCFVDHGAADALAALMVEASEQRNTHITLDVAMNPVLEEDMVEALQGKAKVDLAEMAERYMDSWQAIRESKHRATEARAMARDKMARRRAQEDRWGTVDKDDSNTVYKSERRSEKLADFYSADEEDEQLDSYDDASDNEQYDGDRMNDNYGEDDEDEWHNKIPSESGAKH